MAIQRPNDPSPADYVAISSVDRAADGYVATYSQISDWLTARGRDLGLSGKSEIVELYRDMPSQNTIGLRTDFTNGTSDYYIWMRCAEGEEHDGYNVNSGPVIDAWLRLNTDYTVYDRICFSVPPTTPLYLGNHTIVHSCIVSGTGATPNSFGALQFYGDSSTPSYVVCCLVIATGSSKYSINSLSTSDSYVYSTLARSSGDRGIQKRYIKCSGIVSLKNIDVDYYYSTQLPFGPTGSEDGTGGSEGFLVIPSDFVDYDADNFAPSGPGSSLIGNAMNFYDVRFPNDLVGNPLKQAGNWDSGPYQLTTAAEESKNALFFGSEF